MFRSVQGICALLTCALLLCCSSSAKSGMTALCKNGLTEPLGDIKLEYGKGPLNITCVITNPILLADYPNISELLCFTKAGVEVQNMTWILNSTSIQLYDAHPEKSNNFYGCKFKDGLPGLRDRDVCWNDVSIGVKPYEVTDFSCISNNFENLTCSWTPLNTVVDTTYDLSFHYGSKNDQIKHCPRLNYPGTYEPQSTKIRCILDLNTDPQYRMVVPLYIFTLNMSNEFGDYTNPSHEFLHFKNVRSGPPERLEAVSTTTSSIYLNWSLPNAMVPFPRPLQYRVVYQCEYGPKIWTPGGENNGIVTLYKHEVAAYYYNLTGLANAHTLCDIRVAIRPEPAHDDESMWSTHASINVRTSSMLPGAPPNTTVGSFEISFSEIETATDITRNEVYIYWQQIDEGIKNGEDFKYETVPLGKQKEPPALMEQTNAYAKYGNLILSDTYEFAVYSVNSLGRSVRYSEITVPAQRFRPKEPGSFTKVSFGLGEYELKWEPAAHDEYVDKSALTGYTLFWCSNDRDRPYQCTGHLDWIHLGADVTSYRITVEENKQVTQFAITSNRGTNSSGMLWASCTILHDKFVGKIRDFWINNMGSTHIEVGWKLACSERIGNVVAYNIHYCPIISPKETECKGVTQMQTIEGDEYLIHGRITGLIPYTTYMLRISVVTAISAGGANKTSQVSDALFNTTLEGIPTAPFNLAVLNITNASIALTWDAPLQINGILKYYKIEYNDRSLEVGPGSEKNNKTYDLKGLQSHVMYNITVKACTTECSDPSIMLQVRTKMGYPGTILSIDKRFQNNSYVLLTWPLPNPPRGKINFYQIKIKQEIDYKNETLPITNSTESKYSVTHCGDNNRYNTFYMSVRAVNIIDGDTYPGPWTDEIKFFCKTPPSSIFWLIFSTVMAIFVVLLLWLSRRCYYHYRDMKNVEVKLPPGLATSHMGEGLPYWSDSNTQQSMKNLTGNITLGLNLTSPTNSSQTHHTNLPIHSMFKETQQHQHHQQLQQQQQQQQPITSDEERVLLKMSSRESDRDSSGCSTGHDSATSSLEESTHEDDIDIDVDMEERGEDADDEEVIRNGDRCSSDSGTDQANSNSTNSLNKSNSLRLRKPVAQGAVEGSGGNGYITVPPDMSSAVIATPLAAQSSAPLWSIIPTSAPSNSYCMLGIDPSTASTATGLNDMSGNNAQQNANAGYVSFDSQQIPPLNRGLTITPTLPQQSLPRPSPVSLQHGIKNAVSNVSNGCGYIPLMYGDPSDTENDMATTPPPNLSQPPNYVLASTKQPASPTKIASLIKPQQQEFMPSLIAVNMVNIPNDNQQTTAVNKNTSINDQQFVPPYVQAAPMTKMNHPSVVMASALVDPTNNQLGCLGNATSPGYVSVADVAPPVRLDSREQHTAPKGYVPHRQLSKHD